MWAKRVGVKSQQFYIFLGRAAPYFYLKRTKPTYIFSI